MHSFRQRLFAHLRFRAAAYLVLFVALVPALIVYWRVRTSVRHSDEARFNASATKAEEAFREQLQMLTSDLVAISGFFDANQNLTREEWDAFVARLDMAARHPGIRSVGFAERVNAKEVATFANQVRRQEDRNFTVHPVPTSGVAFPIVRATQFSPNADVRLGWDLYSEIQRRAAIEALMQKGLPVVTDKLRFWYKDQPQAEGFSILVPVWSHKKGEERLPIAIRGVVFISIIPQDMFNALARSKFDSALEVELFDGTSVHASNHLAFAGGSISKDAGFSQTKAANVFGHNFLFRISASRQFHALSQAHLPSAVLCCALAFSFLLAGITWLQGSARSEEEKLNRRLRDSEEKLRGTNTELERKVAEASITEGLLEHERDLLRMLLDHSPDAIYFKDRASRFLKCGRAVTMHLGIENIDDAIGKTDFDFFTEAHARLAFETEQNIIRSGHPIIGLVEKETWRDGHETWVLTSKMPLRNNDGEIIGTFGISKDITKLKEIELALEKKNDLLALTLRSIGDGVITTDVEGRIVLFNQVAERLTGWTQAEAVGRRLKEVFSTKSVETNTEMLRKVLDDNAPSLPRDTVLVERSGLERDISHSIAPITDRGGDKIGAVLVFRDITEKLKAEAELLKASKLESIGVLAGGIAHDFNNILTVILGNISLARMAEDVGKPITESLIEAENASLRARELTQRLLTFARGGMPIKKPIDLSPLVRDCVARSLHGTPVTPEFFVAEDLWAVDADESQIRQVIQNLIQYTRHALSHDPRLDIHVLNHEVAGDSLLLLAPGRYVRISVRDYGAGIQPENLNKIFEPYFGARNQGSGLELATAYSIVRKHDGQIRVESIVGKGTIFHVYLPALLARDFQELVIRPAIVRESIAPRHILVMDDELPIRKLAVHLLQRIGCTAVTAADGAEAIHLYESARQRGEPFGAVIMDLTVPNGLGGKETIRQLKALDPNVQAIVSSGYSNDPVMANFRDFGFVGVVPKPYSSDDLATALDELFCLKQASN